MFHKHMSSFAREVHAAFGLSVFDAVNFYVAKTLTLAIDLGVEP